MSTSDPAKPTNAPDKKGGIFESRTFQICMGAGFAIVLLSVIVLFRVFFGKS